MYKHTLDWTPANRDRDNFYAGTPVFYNDGRHCAFWGTMPSYNSRDRHKVEHGTGRPNGTLALRLGVEPVD